MKQLIRASATRVAYVDDRIWIVFLNRFLFQSDSVIYD